MERFIRGTCRTPECGRSVDFAIGDLSIEEARSAMETTQGYECPGGPHVELGRMYDGYDWDFTVFEKPSTPTDEEWIDYLHSRGHRVLSGTAGRYETLPNLHDLRDLKHLGFGDFASAHHVYIRVDSPRGSRFYIETPQRDRIDESFGPNARAEGGLHA